MQTTLEIPPLETPRKKSKGIFHYFKTPQGRRTFWGYLFISPFILGVMIWVVYPAGMAAWLAFQKWNLITPPKYVGLDNFTTMFADKLFWQSMKVTFTYTFISVPLGLIVAFVLALLINTKVRGLAIFRTVYYLPSIVPAVASAVLWAWIFNTDFGLLNAGLIFSRAAQDRLAAAARMGAARFDHDEPVGGGRGDDHLPGWLAGH